MRTFDLPALKKVANPATSLLRAQNHLNLALAIRQMHPRCWFLHARLCLGDLPGQLLEGMAGDATASYASSGLLRSSFVSKSLHTQRCQFIDLLINPGAFGFESFKSKFQQSFVVGHKRGNIAQV